MSVIHQGGDSRCVRLVVVTLTSPLPVPFMAGNIFLSLYRPRLQYTIERNSCEIWKVEMKQKLLLLNTLSQSEEQVSSFRLLCKIPHFVVEVCWTSPGLAASSPTPGLQTDVIVTLRWSFSSILPDLQSPNGYLKPLISLILRLYFIPKPNW